MFELKEVVLENGGACDAEETIMTYYRSYISDFTDRGYQYLGRVTFCKADLPDPIGTVYIVSVNGTDTKYSPKSGRWVYADGKAASYKYDSVVAAMKGLEKRYIKAKHIDMTRMPDPHELYMLSLMRPDPDPLPYEEFINLE